MIADYRLPTDVLVTPINVLVGGRPWVTAEMIKWCEENVRCRWCNLMASILFTHESDAALFKLFWL